MCYCSDSKGYTQINVDTDNSSWLCVIITDIPVLFYLISLHFFTVSELCSYAHLHVFLVNHNWLKMSYLYILKKIESALHHICIYNIYLRVTTIKLS